MGGHRSGRYGWRGVIESRKRLDVREWSRAGWLTPGRSGTHGWMNDEGERTGSVCYTVLADELQLHYLVSEEDGAEQQVEQMIYLRRVPCRFGGERIYWQCPCCYRRCEIVAMASHGCSWGCRRCLNLRYRSQGLGPADRAEQQSDKICARLGGEHEDGSIYRPKGMRHRTFERLFARADALSQEADAMFLGRLRKLGFKW